MASEQSGSGQYLTFTLGVETFAIDIRTVREIITHCSMTHVPLMPKFIRGIINLRGAVVPVVDLQSRFGWERAVEGKKTCIVIIDSSGESGPLQLGLMVDAVSEVIDIAAADIEPPPQFGTPVHHDLIDGMAKVDDAFIVVLKPERAFDMQVLTGLVEQPEMV
jgi:purine-binding chemotaxis protein CheW